jgi:urease accessory protein
MMPALTLTQLVRMVQLTDSALPIGNFAFSNGLESALQTGVVSNATDLKSFTAVALNQSANMDCIALLHAHRAALLGDIPALINIDNELWCRRVGDEQQLMMRRIGRKFPELVDKFSPTALLKEWLQAITQERTQGTFPVSHAVIFAEMGIGERETFAVHQYGVASMIVGAAMRLMKIDHYTTQQILFEINVSLDRSYDNVSDKLLDDMNSFAPILDCLIGHHNQAHVRMFMN